MSKKKAQSKYNDESFIKNYNNAKIDQLIFSYENYVVEGTEGLLSVLKRINTSSLVKTIQFSKSQSKSQIDSKTTAKSKESFSKTTARLPSAQELDRNLLEAFRNRFLLHNYINIDQATDIQSIPEEIKDYNDCRHASLSKFCRFNLKDLNGEENPCILTERPINGPLYLLFDANNISQFSSSMTSDSEIDLFSNEPGGLSVINDHFYNQPFKLTSKNKFNLIIGIIAGIEFIHRLGKVHGHLNPSNVYLDDNFLPKICGYGFIQPKEIKQDVDENDHDFGALTNIAFIAPEVLSGKAIYQKSDVFSIGMLIYYIISEMEPFQNDRSHVQMSNICDGIMPSFPECISDNWKSIILRCCELSPQTRLSSSELLSYLLQDDNIDKFISDIPNPDSEKESELAKSPDFIKSQDEYISYIIHSFKFDADFQDCYILREMIPDPTAIDEEVKSLIDSASKNDPESLITIANFFLEGKNNLPKDEENAFELFQKAADLGDREGMKMVAKLCRDGTGTKKNLEKALSYNRNALVLFKGDKLEEDILETRIREIEKEIKNPPKPEEKDDDDDNNNNNNLGLFKDTDVEADKLRKKNNSNNRSCTITIHNITSTTTKADIEQAFNNFKDINVQFHTYGLYDSASVTFQSQKDINKFANIYRKSSKMRIRNQDVQIKDLPKTKKEKENELAKKRKMRLKRMPLGAVYSAPKKSKSQSHDEDEDEDESQPNFILNFDDYYPGEGNSEYQKVGNGSYAVAYKAYRKSDNKPFIAKICKRAFRDRADRNYFVRETKALIDINHPLIVHLFGYNQNSLINPKEKLATIMMEYMPNKTLNDVIVQEHNKESPPWWNNTAKIKIIIGIAKAMAYVHEKSYVHRDLKPENIFLDENHEIKIGDFGLSRKYDKKNEVIMTFNIGTPVYNAPEIFDNDNLRYSWEVDVYSFGIILYQIITAKLINEIYPKKRTVISLYNHVKKGNRPSIPKGVNPYLIELMEHCWSSAIDYRPSFQYIYNIFKKTFEIDSPPTTFFPNVDINEIRNYIEKLDSIDDKQA